MSARVGWHCPVLVLLVSMICPLRMEAQRDIPAECRAVLEKLTGEKPESIANCHDLATFLDDSLSSGALEIRLNNAAAADTARLMTPRKVQPLTGEANISGVPGQSDAVPSAQPTALASANVSAVGTDHGTKTLAAISLNPFMLFGSSGDPKAAAKWSRVSDFTILVPTSDQGGSPGDLSYFGVRARFNITGLSAGDNLLGAVNAAFARVVAAEANLTQELETAFLNLPNQSTIEDCAEAILTASYGDSPAECLGKVTVGLNEADYDALRESILEARLKADRNYTGLDLRFDTGDPTLSGDPAKEVTALEAGLAFGRSSVGPNAFGTNFGLTGRIGARYSQLKSSSDSAVWSAEGAVGFEANRLMADNQMVRLSGALEFRFANEPDAEAEAHQTDNLAIRGAMAIPLLGGTSITVAFAAPLVGEMTPSLSVNFNWGLLLSNLPVKKDD